MLNFILTQHCRDEELLINLVTYLRCGSYIPRASGNAGDFLCQSISDILDKIIPFFQKYPILGVKALYFADFVKVADLMKNKSHLNQEGIDKILRIKAGMNKGRKNK